MKKGARSGDYLLKCYLCRAVRVPLFGTRNLHYSSTGGHKRVATRSPSTDKVFTVACYRFFRRHRPVYWVLMVALFAFFGYFAAQIHLEEDINKLLPSSKNEDGTTKLAFADLRIKDKVFLMFEANNEDVDTDELAEACDTFVGELLSADDEREEASRMVGDAFYYLDDDLLPDVVDYLTEHLPAYVDTSVYAGLDTLLTAGHMAQQMEQNRRDLTGTVGQLFPELIQMDPIGLRSVMGSALTGLTNGGGTGGYEIVDGHFFTRDHTVCLCFLTPSHASTDTGAGADLFRWLNKHISEWAGSRPDITVSYHGTPASGFYNSTRIKQDMKETIGVSLLIVLAFLLVSFRRLRTLPLLVLPVAFGALFGLAIMYFIKGQFSLLALGIGAIVLGVAFSYVLHIITHQKFVSHPARVLRDETKPVLLGCITTIGSFMGLIFIQTELLQDFGLFAALAIVGTTAFSLLFLPQLLTPERRGVNPVMFALVNKINAYPFHRKKPLLLLIAVIAVVCIGFYVARGIEFDANMHNLGYLAPNTTRSEEVLREKTFVGDRQKYFAASGETMEAALEHFGLMDGVLDSLSRIGIVKSYSPTDEILVPLRVQEERIAAWEAYWTDERIERVRSLVKETAPSAGLKPEAFAPFFDMVSADYEADALYEAGLIPTGYLSTLMEQSADGQFLCFTSVRCLLNDDDDDESDFQRICDAVAHTPHLLVLDTYYYTRETLASMNSDFSVLQWISMLFVLVVLFFSFRRNVKHTLIGFMPILLSWLIVLGAMAMCGREFNVINIIISTFIFGIGVDYSIFVMNGLIEGQQPQEGEEPGQTRTTTLFFYHKTAIFFSAVILIVTVGSMLFAKHPAIRSVGFSTLVGMVAAVVLSYVTQPAIYERFCKKKEKP